MQTGTMPVLMQGGNAVMVPLIGKKTILFDLDGTITDSGEGIMNSVKYTLDAFGISDYDKPFLQRFVGPPLKEFMMKIFGFDEEKARLAVVKYREYYGKSGIYENRLYDGIEDLLRDLKGAGKIVALATSKTEMYMKMVLDHFGITQYFDVAAGSLFDGSRVRKGEVVRHALELVRDGLAGGRIIGAFGDIAESISGSAAEKIFLERAVMIGDREQDVDGAKENGIESVGVLYGYGSLGELKEAGATYIVRTIDELRDRLLGENR